MNRTNLQKEVFNPILGERTKGFFDANELEELKINCIEISIPKGMEYRPDLIANYYLGDPNLAWAITFCNNFTEGLREYTLGRTIKLPKIN